MVKSSVTFFNPRAIHSTGRAVPSLVVHVRPTSARQAKKEPGTRRNLTLKSEHGTGLVLFLRCGLLVDTPRPTYGDVFFDDFVRCPEWYTGS